METPELAAPVDKVAEQEARQDLAEPARAVVPVLALEHRVEVGPVDLVAVQVRQTGALVSQRMEWQAKRKFARRSRKP